MQKSITIKSIPKQVELDLEELIKSKTNQNRLYASKPAAMFHEFYLSGTIGDAEDYVQVFDMIRHANEQDIIKIYINSPGGNLFTALQFGRAIADCSGTVIVSVEGQCCSAATIIALAADMVELSNHCVWMCHTYSGGAIGKGNELHAQMDFESKWSEALFRDVYDGFLLDKEIDSMLAGRDIWLNSNDVMKRLEQRHNKMKRQAKKASREVTLNRDKVTTDDE